MLGRYRLGLLLAFIPTLLLAQDWRSQLKSEESKNAVRLSDIETSGKPLAAQLKQVTSQVTQHNANRCTAPADNPGVCAWYDAEATRLQSARDSLRSQLQRLVDEYDSLQARNNALERRLHCLQPTVICHSNSDCSCSESCAAWPDGARSDSGRCQPAPR